MNLSIYGDKKLLDDAEKLIIDLESKLSTTDKNSEIFKLNQDKKAILSDDTVKLLKKSLEFCKKTDGAIDLSIYPVLKQWGFTTGDYKVPDDETISNLLPNVDYNKIKLNANEASLADNMQIDLGSVAKGYTGDKVISLFRKNGVKSVLINLGGNVQALGSKPDGTPWNIAIRDPFSSKNAVAIEIKDKAVITSGVYERYFEQDNQIYWHIIDPKTGAPARNGLVSVTIIGESGLRCDALSTALFVMGREKAIEFWKSHENFDVIFIESDGNISVTQGLKFTATAIDDYKNQNIKIIKK